MKWVFLGTVVILTAYTIYKFWKGRADDDTKESIPEPPTQHWKMQERDYILRQLQAFAQALAEIIARRNDGKILDTIYMLDDLIRSDSEAREIVDMPLNQFTESIDLKEKFDCDKWALIAEALYEKALLLEIDGQFQVARNYELKAMHLVLEVLLSSPETYRQSTQDLLVQMRKHITIDELPDGTARLLQEFAAGPN